MGKEFITCDMIRDAALKLVRKMHIEDGFVPDVIYDSLRGGAYMANVMSEYYKLMAMKEGRQPVFYAAVVARSYGAVKEHSSHVDIDGWTWSPRNLRKGQKILIVDDIFDTGMTVNALVNTVMDAGIPREDIKVAVNGAGAAAISITKLLIAAGVRNVTLCDRTGAIYEGREKGMNPIKEEMAKITNPEKIQGSLADIVKGADVFIGVSAPEHM